MVAPPASGSIETFKTDPPVKTAWGGRFEENRTIVNTHHRYMTELMPSYGKELEGGDDDSGSGDDPCGEDDDGIDDDLRRL